MIFNNFIELCYYRHNLVLEHFYHIQKVPFACLSMTLIPIQPQETTDLFCLYHFF